MISPYAFSKSKRPSKQTRSKFIRSLRPCSLLETFFMPILDLACETRHQTARQKGSSLHMPNATTLPATPNSKKTYEACKAYLHFSRFS